MKVLPKDAHGYVNSRGKSRYWGVTTGLNPQGKDYWLVSFAATDLKQTVTLQPDVTLTEVDAARIAAYVYEQGQTYNGLQSDLILSANGKYVYHINRTNRKIYRNAYKPDMVIYNTNSAPKLDEFVAEEAAVVVEQKVEVTQPKVQVKKKMTEDAFDMLLALLDQMEMTTEQTLKLIAKVTAK